MRAFLITFCLVVICLGAHAGEREGHAGDPLIADFFKRGRFTLNEMRRTGAIERAYIDTYARAYQELRVEVSNAPLPNVGRVEKDPDRPGKQFVLLDRKIYGDCYEKRTQMDLNAFVAHEIFETVAVDYGYEVSRRLRFSEDEYQRWYRGYDEPGKSDNPYDRYAAFAYSFETGTWGISWDRPTSAEASTAAYRECKADDCQVLSWVRNGCLALASAYLDPMVIGFAWDVSRKKAAQFALQRCQQKGQLCKNIESVCPSTAKP